MELRVLVRESCSWLVVLQNLGKVEMPGISLYKR